VNKTLLDSVGCDYEDIAWVIDVLNTVEGISYTTLITQKGEYIRASLRTLRDDVDVSLIAQQFSGWGHKKSSGFTTKWVALWQPGIKIIDSL
jgi:nanoRNase/pAp phosphatase (c-di-AMP/oligoRNAs hydrolase)